MKVGIYTLGCKVNTYESNFIISLFKEKGFVISDFDDMCDIYIINTCTVTNNSDKKSEKIIRNAIRRNPDACIVGIGCHMEYNKDKKIPGVNITIGNYNKSKIVELVEEWFKNKQDIITFSDMNNVAFEDMEINHFENRTRAFVKIQDGCNNFCSYCVIPYVRGRCRSKEEIKVISEITTLVNNGYQEIVLTGIHTGNYGRDINTCFSDLVTNILKINGLVRLRISSIEITELDDQFLELLKNDILCNHLHIPLQSGCNKILRLMNRKYDTDYFYDMINKIRKVRPDISITTDIIVGFPDENDDDFNETMEFVKKINFSKVHVFPYSKRDGTVAAKMPNQVNESDKKLRTKQLISLSNQLEKEYSLNFINKELDVLIEKTDNNYSYGHTSNYLYLKIKKALKSNMIYNIKVTKDMLEE